jgi:CrcB protein
MYLKQIIAIMCGGAIGSALRFISAQKLQQLLGIRFPYGTLFVNVLGSLLIGFLSALLIERLDLSPVWRAAILIGFLGGFTTFSTFSLDTYSLFEQGDHWIAALNIFLSVGLCLIATLSGVLLGRTL